MIGMQVVNGVEHEREATIEETHPKEIQLTTDAATLLVVVRRGIEGGRRRVASWS